MSRDPITGIKIKGSNFYIDGKKTQLAGNHTWNTVQRVGGERIGMDKITGNFTRLWTLESRQVNFGDSTWGSNSRGTVRVNDVPWNKDGSLNDSYYQALEGAVKSAQKRGIVVSVVLFEGSIPTNFTGSNNAAWKSHSFNGLGPRDPSEVHTKGRWNKYQKSHVERVVRTLQKYNNVVYEVGNELHRNSVRWFQPAVVRWVNQLTDKPVGVSYAQGMKPSRGRSQNWMTRVDADWIAPSGSTRLRGFRGPQVFDTDHTSPLRSNVPALQSAWNDGSSLLLMDGFNGTILRNQNSLRPDLNFINDVLG